MTQVQYPTEREFLEMNESGKCDRDWLVVMPDFSYRQVIRRIELECHDLENTSKTENKEPLMVKGGALDRPYYRTNNNQPVKALYIPISSYRIHY